jgi:hypothetical protein
MSLLGKKVSSTQTLPFARTKSSVTGKRMIYSSSAFLFFTSLIDEPTRLRPKQKEASVRRKRRSPCTCSENHKLLGLLLLQHLVEGKTPAEVIIIILSRGPLFPVWGLVAFGELEPLKLGELYRQRAERAGQTLLAAGRLAGRFRQRSLLYSERAQVRPLSLRQHPLGRHLGKRAVAREAALLVRRVNTTAETLNPRTGVSGPARALSEEPCRPLLRKLAADIAVEDGCRIPFRIGQHQFVLGRGSSFGIL